MQAATLSIDEAARVRTLHQLRILDTGAEPGYDAIARMASRQLGCPIGAVTLVDSERLWFKALHGADMREAPRAASFCEHTILRGEPLWVEDATRDARFAGSALVNGASHMRFYAGVPIEVQGQRVGSVCAVDKRPRTLDDTQRGAMKDLAAAAGELMAARLREQRLLAQETANRDGAQYRMLFELAPLPLLMYDCGTLRLRCVNSAALQHYGYSRAEFARMTLSDLCPPEHAFQQARSALAEPGRGLRTMWRHRDRGGRLMDMEVVVSAPLAFASGPARIALAFDVSERRALAATRERFDDKKRSLQVHELARRARSEMLSRVSHEFRTPLNAILGFTQLLAADSDPPDGARKAYTGHILRASHDLLGLVETMLELRRIDAGEMKLEIAPLDLAALVAASLNLLDPLPAASGVEVRGDAAADITVYADGQRLQQVLVAVFGRAVGASRTAGAVEWSARYTRPGRAELVVTDRGGPPEPGAAEPGSAHGGADMMLAHVLLERMGGTLSFADEPRRGTRATIELPASSAAKPPGTYPG